MQRFFQHRGQFAPRIAITVCLEEDDEGRTVLAEFWLNGCPLPVSRGPPNSSNAVRLSAPSQERRGLHNLLVNARSTPVDSAPPDRRRPEGPWRWSRSLLCAAHPNGSGAMP